MKSKKEIISELEDFQQLLYNWEHQFLPQTRSSINKKIPFVQKILRLAGTSKTITISPPMVGGLVVRDVDPFTCIYEPPYGMSVVGVISEIHELKLASKILVSIVSHTSGNVTHDRNILTNYHLITSGHGFGVIDYRGVKENAMGEVKSTLHNICFLPSTSSVKHQHSHILDWMKDIYIDRRGMESLYAFEVGDSFNNRLLSE